MGTKIPFLGGMLVFGVCVILSGCGKKKDFDKGDELGQSVLGGEGGGRVQSGMQSVIQPGFGSGPTKIRVQKTIRVPKARPTYNIVPVTQIITATSGIPSDWTAADLIFTSTKPPAAIGAPALDTQTPFYFDFDWPSNNYQFTEASLVIDTSRDTSGTEGIFVDGVFTGNPPLSGGSYPSATSSKILHRLYEGSGAATPNTYYIDYSSLHYKRLTNNTFTLSLLDLLSGSPLTPLAILEDGRVNVTTGDDSPVYQAYLVIKGLTTSGDALDCQLSSAYTFTNTYIHNDGNTIGQAAFSGTMGTPYTSWNSLGTYPAFEFNFDAPLPKVTVQNITVTSATLQLTAKKSGAGTAAMVINGIGISQTGFDRSSATAEVESWDDTATAAFESFLSGVGTAVGGSVVSLDLIALFGGGQTGQDKVRALLAQGQLNISVAGNLYASGTGQTSARTALAPIDGPELVFAGTYKTEICNVPNNPDSPLTQNGVVDPPVEYEDKIVWEEVDATSTDVGTGGTVVITNDGAGPLIGSLQTLQITNNSATIVWSTDEGSTSQVLYGVGGLTSQTAEDSKLTTFHQVQLTGLSPYKYYSFQVVTKDRYGNESRSPITVFTTLR